MQTSYSLTSNLIDIISNSTLNIKTVAINFVMTITKYNLTIYQHIIIKST